MKRVPPSTHAVQLFDDDISRSHALAGFVRQGLEGGNHVLLVVTPPHWEAGRARLEGRSESVRDAMASGQLTVVDAGQTLDRFMSHGTVDRQLFDETVGALVRRMQRDASRLRAYGEMVDLLAVEGRFAQALELELVWNELLQSETVDLLCGYSSVSFGDPGNREALADICQAHAHVRFSPSDRLGAFLLHTDRGGRSAPTSDRAC